MKKQGFDDHVFPVVPVEELKKMPSELWEAYQQLWYAYQELWKAYRSLRRTDQERQEASKASYFC